jgi:hypothetical protein
MIVPECRPTSDAASWWLLGGTAALLVLCMARTGFSIAPGSSPLPLLGLTVLLVTALVGRARNMPRLTAAATAFLQLTLFTILGVMLSYVLAARAGPMWDTQLAAWDAWLQIDWPAIRAALDKSPGAVWVLGLAYNGLVAQMIVVVVALSVLGRFRVLRVTVAAALLSGLATILVSGILPAAGNLFDPSQYSHLWTPVALAQAPLIAGLRDGSVRVLDLSAMQGIVTFPSYHAALAAIFIFAFRHTGRLAAPGSISAGVTIAATPIGGGHYAIDVIGGLGLAAASLVLAAWLVGSIDFGWLASSRSPIMRPRPRRQLRSPAGA